MLCSSATCLTSKLDTEAESEVSIGVLQGHVAARATLSLTRSTWRQNCPIGAGSVYKGRGMGGVLFIRSLSASSSGKNSPELDDYKRWLVCHQSKHVKAAQ